MSIAHVKNAAITTVTVLIFIYVLRQVSVTKPFVDRALIG